jgi:hypothetical protein
LPVQNVQPVFYDCDPQKGGIPIGSTQTVSANLMEGENQEISVSWTVPILPQSHVVFVVVDPGLAFEDRDRSNNSASLAAVLADLTIQTCWSAAVSSSSVALTARVLNSGVIPLAGPMMRRVVEPYGA